MAKLHEQAGKSDSQRILRWRAAFFGLSVAALASSAPAADLYQGDGLELRWDNTIRYSAGFRLPPRDHDLISDPNTDDGDRNFAPGIISNRLDILSQFDLSDGNFGIHASGDAWYDTVYQSRNDNNSPATFNPISVPHNEFTRTVQTLQGDSAELGDAFVYGSFEAADAAVSFRIGRHALLWGESLFFADNGIAAGQAPIDAIKDFSQPEAKANELFLPVAQASATIQLMPNISVSLYDQFEWRKTRLPGSGSYFSDSDILDAGGERLIIQPGEYLYRAADKSAPASGQFGVSLRASGGDVDFGLYAVQFNAKEPEIFLLPGIEAGPGGTIKIVDPSIVDLSVGRVGDYQLVYPTGIDIYGASVSFYLGDSAIAGEISARTNMPLVSGLTGIPGLVGGGYGESAAALRQRGAPPYDVIAIAPQTNYAVGDTLHAQLSSVSTLPPGKFWDGATLSTEFAANDRLVVTGNYETLDTSRTRFALALRSVVAAQYFEVLPSLDLELPIGVGFGLSGRSSTDASQNAGAGDIEIGVDASYRAVWKGSITLTHYLGSPAWQPLADRDFVSVSLERTL